MADLNLCPGCFEEIEMTATFCPHCGLNEKYKNNDPKFLPIGTVLKEKYRIGQQVVFNNESVVYYGYDMLSERKVFIREYFPGNLCVRASDGSSVSIVHGHEAAYKTLLHDFIQITEDLSKYNGLSCLLDVFEIFNENATAYVVSQYVPVMSLRAFVQKADRDFTFEEVQNHVEVFANSVGILHEAGIVHRGLSPDTIYITENQEIKLLGFASASIRTANNNGSAELFNGYAAPEQYKADGWQGEWTDVYGFCACLYFLLTGTDPDSAVAREENDSLLSIHLLNKKISKRVSNAIMQGLALDPANRIKSLKELLQDLKGESASALSEKKSEKEKKTDDGPWYLNRWMIGLYSYLATILVFSLIVFISWNVFKNNSNSGGVISSSQSEETSSESDDSIVPNFVGKTIAEINDDDTLSIYDLNVTEDYHDSIPVGTIISQDPISGSDYEEGMVIEVVTSKGPQSVVMINVVNLPIETAKVQLTNAGILFDVYEVYSESVEPGLVVRTSVAAGQSVTPSKERVQIFVAK